MSDSAPTDRAVVIDDLFTALEELLFTYQLMPVGERQQRFDTDADRITGELSRRLAATRARLSPASTPRPTRAGS